MVTNRFVPWDVADDFDSAAPYLSCHPSSTVQEVKRIFGLWSNFGLAASMISVILGIIPLYTYSLTNGGKNSF